MPLRNLRLYLVSPSDDDSDRDHEKEAQADGPPEGEKRSLWRSGLLIATSAALGGIAVAVWNRRTLAKMRQPPPTDL
jgi:hypothetical protein